MNTLVVIGYNDLSQAEEVRLKLWKLQKDYLIDLEDAVVAAQNQGRKIKPHQAVNLTATGAVSGSFWGSLLGLIFLNPLLGLAIGAAAGAVSGALTDVGIDDKFMKDRAATRQPGHPAPSPSTKSTRRVFRTRSTWTPLSPRLRRWCMTP
jgi:uncharacterized membrane protein